MEEHFERIPWATLASAERTTRWTWYIGVAVLVTGLAAAVVVLTVSDGATPEPVALGDVSESFQLVAPATEAPAVEAPATEATTSMAPVADVPAPVAYSEADLMAVVPSLDDVLVFAAAEDYARSFFAGDVMLEELPGEPAASRGHVAYVEWARAYSIDRTGDRYEVAVALRMVLGPPGGPFARQPLRTVRVDVVATGDGLSAVGFPRLAGEDLAEGRTQIQSVANPDELPAGVVAKATSAASGWGPATVVGGYLRDGGWTVLVDIESAAGGYWTVGVDVGAVEG